MEFINSIIVAIFALLGLGTIANENASTETFKAEMVETMEFTNQNNNKVYMWTNYQKPEADELKTVMEDTEFKITQQEGTEPAGTSPLNKNYEPGIYVDILSGEPLFSSRDKYDSGTGWPSFTQPIEKGAVSEHTDTKLFLPRTEIRSNIADNHLGHVFNDGPVESTGLRYCMNGVALKFIPKAEMEAAGYGDFLKYL
jgi:peptide methionine sulfoxide reductase msrA/msrB